MEIDVRVDLIEIGYIHRKFKLDYCTWLVSTNFYDVQLIKT